MAGYTKRNLNDEVDDSALKFGMSEVLEAHFARDDLECTKLGISLQRLKPDARMPFGHSHGEQEEVYVVVGGGGRAKLEDDVVELKQWDALRVPKDTTRGFEAGPEGMEIIAIGGPNTGPGDADMADDFWPG